MNECGAVRAELPINRANEPVILEDEFNPPARRDHKVEFSVLDRSREVLY
jgi:hypothetical protein